MEALTSEKAVNLIQEVQRKIEETRWPENTAYPARFAEIIQIFKQIRNGIIRVKDSGDTVMLEVEFDDSLPSHELRLRITRDARGLIEKVLGRGNVSTEISIFTETGYRTATETTLDSQRYKDPPLLAGDQKPKTAAKKDQPQKERRLRENPYSKSSYTNLSTIINKFHELLGKSSQIQLHATRTV